MALHALSLMSLIGLLASGGEHRLAHLVVDARARSS